MMQRLADILPQLFPIILAINGLLLIAVEIFFKKDNTDDKKGNDR